MKVGQYQDVPSQPVLLEGANGVSVRVVVGETQGAPNFVMRVFEVAAGGNTPYHTHDFEHEVFVLAGEGCLVEEGREEPLRSGDVVFVAPGVIHQFRAASASHLRFICVVPKG